MKNKKSFRQNPKMSDFSFSSFLFLDLRLFKSKLENTGVSFIVVYASLPLVLPHHHQKQSKFITEKSENLNKVKRNHTSTHKEETHTNRKCAYTHIHFQYRCKGRD